MKIQNLIAIFAVAIIAAMISGCSSAEPDTAAANLPERVTTADRSKPAGQANAAAQGTVAPQ